MCGIAGILNIKVQTKELRDKALKMAQKIRHRGPDWSGIYVGGSAILAHERLSIVDPQIQRVGASRYTLPIVNKCSPSTVRFTTTVIFALNMRENITFRPEVTVR